MSEDQREALGVAISNYFAGQKIEGWDCHDSRNVDDLIDRAILPHVCAPADAKPVLRITKNGPYIETQPTEEAFELPSGEYELFTHAGPVSAVETAVRAERAAQDAQWGGAVHDDSHDTGDFLEFIAIQAGKAVHDYDMAKTRQDEDAAFRARFVKIAALAWAAIESIDRKANA
jgi:hypothetical protein